MAQDYNLWQKLLNASDKLGDATLGKWFPLENRETNFQKAVSQAQQESGGNLTAIRKANPMVYKAILDNKITPDQGREIVTKGFVQEWKNASQPVAQPQTQQVLGESTVIPKVISLLSDPQYQKVANFVGSYPGSKIDQSYLEMLAQNSPDIDTLKRIIAASVSETGMGKNAYANPNSPSRDAMKNANYWGYYVGGDRTYDPAREEMAAIIAKAFGPGGRYSNLNEESINRYTGGDRSSNWANIYNWAMSQMR